MVRALHRRRRKVIDQTIATYQAAHHPDEQTLNALRAKLDFEMTRVIAIVDESIIKERIQRARYTFWITGIIGTAFILSFATFPVMTPLVPFFAPLVGAMSAWIAAIATIPVSYNTRVKGAMDSAVEMFTMEQAGRHAHLEDNRSNVIQETLSSMQQTINRQSEEIRQLKQAVRKLAPPSPKAARAALFWRPSGSQSVPMMAAEDGNYPPRRGLSVI